MRKTYRQKEGVKCINCKRQRKKRDYVLMGEKR